MTKYMDDTQHGVFATRAPSRPNSIGISIVRLIKVEKNLLYIKDIDIVDGSALLDIKPFVDTFDSRLNGRTGWLEKNIKKLPKAKDDGRFVKQEVLSNDGRFIHNAFLRILQTGKRISKEIRDQCK